MILQAYILFFRILIYINQPSIDAVPSILSGIERVNLVLSLLLARVWFCSYRIEDAAFHQIKLHEDLLKFKKASKAREKKLADAIIDKMSNHLWYTAQEFVVFALVSDLVTNDDKKALASAISRQPGGQCKPGRV